MLSQLWSGPSCLCITPFERRCDFRHFDIPTGFLRPNPHVFDQSSCLSMWVLYDLFDTKHPSAWHPNFRENLLYLLRGVPLRPSTYGFFNLCLSVNAMVIVRKVRSDEVFSPYSLHHSVIYRVRVGPNDNVRRCVWCTGRRKTRVRVRRDYTGYRGTRWSANLTQN